MPNVRSIRFFRAGLVLVPLISFMVVLGCKSGSTAPAPPLTTLGKLQKAENDITIAVSGALAVTESLEAGGLVSQTLAAQIATDLQKVTTVNNQLITITKGLSTLTPAQLSQIQNIVTPVSQAIQQDITSGILGIKDPKSQAAASAALAAVLVILQTVLSLGV